MIKVSLPSSIKTSFIAATLLFTGENLAQTLTFDPLDPFENIASAEQWRDTYRTQGEIDPNDPFHNLTASQMWLRTWGGQWKTAAENGINLEDFYDTIQGNSGNSYQLQSPYAYDTAEEHWQAWIEAANGGTQHSRSSVPDWSGDWNGEASTRGLLGGGAQLRDIYAGISDEYKPYYIQAVQAELEGRNWWPADTCLPNGFLRDGWRIRFVSTESDMTVFMKDQPVAENRFIFTDGRGFLHEDWALSQWYGESQGIWDGDELVIWTKNIKGWSGGHGLPEYSDSMEVIERWAKVGEQLLVDITLYDPLAFAYPWHDVAVFDAAESLDKWMEQPPSLNDCVSTNNTYHDELGLINEYSPLHPEYHDPFDTRPWIKSYENAEEAKRQGLLPAAEYFIDLE